MTSKETVFFTGGAGFIGMHVVPMLLEKDYKVRIFDNMFRGDRDAVAALGDDVELIDQDVRYGGAVHAAMKGCSKVIHAAAVSINKSQADPYESMDINMIGNHNVFAAAADHGVDRLVYCSSASVYGDPEKLPMHEDDTAQPADAVLHLQARRRGPARLLRAPQRTCRGSRCGSSTSTAPARRPRPTTRRSSTTSSTGSRTASRRSSTARASSRWTSSTSTTSPARSCSRSSREQANVPVNIGTGIDTTDRRAGPHPHRRPSAPTWSRIFNPRDVLVSRRAADITRAREVLGFEPTIDVAQGMTDLIRTGG